MIIWYRWKVILKQTRKCIINRCKFNVNKHTIFWKMLHLGVLAKENKNTKTSLKIWLIKQFMEKNSLCVMQHCLFLVHYYHTWIILHMHSLFTCLSSSCSIFSHFLDVSPPAWLCIYIPCDFWKHKLQVIISFGITAAFGEYTNILLN